MNAHKKWPCGSVIKPCTCKSTYQDGIYGKGMRVWNKGGRDKPNETCTSCGTRKFL